MSADPPIMVDVAIVLMHEGRRDNPNYSYHGDCTFAIALVDAGSVLPGEASCRHGRGACFVCEGHDCQSWLQRREQITRHGPVAIVRHPDVGRQVELEQIASTLWNGLTVIPPTKPMELLIADSVEAMPSGIHAVLVEVQ